VGVSAYRILSFNMLSPLILPVHTQPHRSNEEKGRGALLILYLFVRVFVSMHFIYKKKN
jgi:hypothetical protein